MSNEPVQIWTPRRWGPWTVFGHAAALLSLVRAVQTETWWLVGLFAAAALIGIFQSLWPRSRSVDPGLPGVLIDGTIVIVRGLEGEEHHIPLAEARARVSRGGDDGLPIPRGIHPDAVRMLRAQGRKAPQLLIEHGLEATPVVAASQDLIDREKACTQINEAISRARVQLRIGEPPFED